MSISNEITIQERYEISLKELAKYGRNVTEKQWLQIAKEKNLLTPVSMKGFARITWGEIYKESKKYRKDLTK